jgi:hypothetical protein
VFYSDDYSNPLSGWQESSHAGEKVQYSGGQYVISRPKGNWLDWSCANRNFADAVLTVDAIFVSGDAGQTGTTVLWRYVDKNNFYLLEITGDGQFTIDKLVKGEWQIINDWTLSPAINKGQQINKIAIAFGGGTSTIYINNKDVMSIQDSTFTSGDVCLGAFASETSAVEVSFDNLVIYTIDSWTPPQQ